MRFHCALVLAICSTLQAQSVINLRSFAATLTSVRLADMRMIGFSDTSVIVRTSQKTDSFSYKSLRMIEFDDSPITAADRPSPGPATHPVIGHDQGFIVRQLSRGGIAFQLGNPAPGRGRAIAIFTLGGKLVKKIAVGASGNALWDARGEKRAPGCYCATLRQGNVALSSRPFVVK